MEIKELVNECGTIGITITSEMEKQLLRYAELLKEWNEKINLTAITEEKEIIEKHFYDCILPLKDCDMGQDVCDVGSGAGFPGLVWKIVRPDLHLVLLEPTGKRCTFLKAVIEDLGLKDVDVINERAEDFAVANRESFDTVTARAVANLRMLAELCIPLVKQGGVFLAMKGSKGLEEEREARNAVQKLGCELQDTIIQHIPSGERTDLVYTKVRPTPAKYPRNYGQIKKKPL